ncbi:hypothetical protein RCC89_16330 [Cytophagaceae bacterium ABcell3]|nr:hypothetical protein RCC89_16330 [Cytophagaceae bacterium ABcell3]
MELFESKKTKGIKSHIANLVAIAKSDGKFSVGEKKLVFQIGERNGITKEKVKKIIKSDKPIKFKVPDNDSARFDRVYDLVEMLLADGINEDDEVQAVIDITEKLGFRKAISGVLVNKIIRGVDDPEKTKADVKEECANFLTY